MNETLAECLRRYSTLCMFLVTFWRLEKITRIAVPLLPGIEVFCKNFAFPFELGPVRPPSPGLTFYGDSFSVCIIFIRILEVIEVDP